MELDKANSSLWEGRVIRVGRESRELKKANVTLVRRRHTKEMGPATQPEKKHLQACEEPTVKVPSWLKEAAAE
jgi:hypothetical protein